MNDTPTTTCAWCGEEYERESVSDSDGICPKCEREVLGEMDDGFEAAADCVSGYGGN